MTKVRRGRENQPHVKRAMLMDATARPAKQVTKETDDQIEAKLAERFGIVATMTRAATQGIARACIFSGPAGLGKSYTVEKVLAGWDPEQKNHTIVKGYVKATGLYKLLYQYSRAGQVIVFDDADSIFFDDTALSLLKAVCDTTDTRTVHYLAEGGLVDEETGVKIPRTFEFEGTVLFITNLDFDVLVEKGHKLAPHLQALISRSHYIDLAMKTKRDYLVRIRQVIREGLLSNRGLTAKQQTDTVAFVEEHADNLRELSLRIVIKIGDVARANPTEWRSIARVTCCRNQ